MPSVFHTLLRSLMLALLLTPGAWAGGFHVNGQLLPEATVRQLEQAYQTQLLPGRYWYDRISGAWGQEGGPALGQIDPNLALGGPLRADASGGTTGIFINGRQIPLLELLLLSQQLGAVPPGRYWLNHLGQGGREGGPAQFQLRAITSGSGDTGYNRNTPGGGLMSDGNCSGYLHPSGATVMTGDC